MIIQYLKLLIIASWKLWGGCALLFAFIGVFAELSPATIIGFTVVGAVVGLIAAGIYEMTRND